MMQGTGSDGSDDLEGGHLLGRGGNRGPELEIIGAGLPRTATNSLMAALHILGYKTAHMESMIRQGQHLCVPMCNLATKGQCIDVDGQKTTVSRLLTSSGYNACVDFPWVCYYKELAAENPNAKVILSVRGVDGWIKSFAGLENQVGNIIRKFLWPFSKLICWKTPQLFIQMNLTLHSKFPGSGLHYMRDPVNETLRGAPFKHDHETMRAAYEAHNADVKATIAPERLLVFDCKEGWEPLCKFLGKPVPNVPFPTTNSTASGGAFQTVMWKSFKETMWESWFGSAEKTPVKGMTRAV